MRTGMVVGRRVHVDDRPAHRHLAPRLHLVLAPVAAGDEAGDQLVAVDLVAGAHHDRLDLLDVRAEPLHQRAHRRDDDVGRRAAGGAATSPAGGGPSSRTTATPARTAASPTPGTARPRRRPGTGARSRTSRSASAPVGTASSSGRRVVTPGQRRHEQRPGGVGHRHRRLRGRSPRAAPAPRRGAARGRRAAGRVAVTRELRRTGAPVTVDRHSALTDATGRQRRSEAQLKRFMAASMPSVDDAARPRRRPPRARRRSRSRSRLENFFSTWSTPCSLRHRLAHADAHAEEVVGVEVRLDRTQPVVPGEAAAVLHLERADGQVELVLHDHELLGLDAVAPRRARRPPARSRSCT